MVKGRDVEGAREIYLAEYNRLRDEIDNRTRISAGLVAVQLAALGAGLASLESFPDAAIGMAIASAVLWMLWSDQEVQIWKVAAYIQVVLAARLGESCPGALGWEPFLRRLDKGGDDAAEVLGLAAGGPQPPPVRTGNVGFYVSLLLGGAPLVLFVTHASLALFDDMSGAGRVVRVGMLVGALIVWSAGLYVYRRSRRFRTSIDLAILSCDRVADDSDGSAIVQETVAGRTSAAATKARTAPRHVKTG